MKLNGAHNTLNFARKKTVVYPKLIKNKTKALFNKATTGSLSRPITIQVPFISYDDWDLAGSLQSIVNNSLIILTRLSIYCNGKTKANISFWPLNAQLKLLSYLSVI